MKLYEVRPLGAEMVIVVPPLSVRTRLYEDILFVAEGATHIMLMVVLPVEVTPTEVGGEGLGGAVGNQFK